MIKPYFNALFEDKEGFDPYQEWIEVQKLVKYNGRTIYILLG